MFEEGSDMETIVLKYNVGDTAGIVEYTIDAIKYIYQLCKHPCYGTHCHLSHERNYAPNGIPISFSSSQASSSVFAVVTITTFIPRILSILS